MIRPLLLILLLIASPAWADPIFLPVLPGTTAVPDNQNPTTIIWHIITTEFESTGGVNLGAHWFYQGQDYCRTTSGTECFAPHGPAQVAGRADVIFDVPMAVLHCSEFICQDTATVPASIHGFFRFAPTDTTFEFEGTGIATLRLFGIDGFIADTRLDHADFGQTPEPATWLLLLTGVLLLIGSSARRCRV